MSCVYRTGCQNSEVCQKEGRCCAPLATQLVPLASNERIDNLVAVIETQAATIARLRGELGAAEQHVRILQAQVQSFSPETGGNVTRLEPQNTKLAKICDIYDDLIREMRRQGFATLQGVYDGKRIRVDDWPDSSPKTPVPRPGYMGDINGPGCDPDVP